MEPVRHSRNAPLWITLMLIVFSASNLVEHLAGYHHSWVILGLSAAMLLWAAWELLRSWRDRR